MDKKLKEEKIVVEGSNNDSAIGMCFGMMLGSAAGLVLTLIYEVDFGYLYGISAGMMIGIIVDCYRHEKKKSSKKEKTSKSKE